MEMFMFLAIAIMPPSIMIMLQSNMIHKVSKNGFGDMMDLVIIPIKLLISHSMIARMYTSPVPVMVIQPVLILSQLNMFNS